MSPLRLLAESLRSVVEWLIGGLPGPPGFALRWLYYKLILRDLGWGTLIDVGVRIENPRTVSIGRRVWIDRNVLILGAVADPLKGRPGRWVRRDPEVEGRVVIGDETHIAPGCLLSGLAGLRVGRELTLAAGTLVYSLSHHYRSLDSAEAALFSPRVAADLQFMIAGPVEIGDRAGVGARSIVLPGSRLASGSFLQLGSVLRGDTEPDRLYRGNPAELIGARAAAR